MATESASEKFNFTIQKFNKRIHDRGDFSCGSAPLDNLLKNSLSREIKGGMFTAWILTEESKNTVLGYYTLGAMVVERELGLKQWENAAVPYIPVIFIRAFAIHRDLQGRGLGNFLLTDALKRCLQISSEVGAAAIVLDVLNDKNFDRRWKFYANLGFRALNAPNLPERVFIPMSDVSKSFAKVDS